MKKLFGFALISLLLWVSASVSAADFWPAHCIKPLAIAKPSTARSRRAAAATITRAVLIVGMTTFIPLPGQRDRKLPSQ